MAEAAEVPLHPCFRGFALGSRDLSEKVELGGVEELEHMLGRVPCARSPEGFTRDDLIE